MRALNDCSRLNATLVRAVLDHELAARTGLRSPGRSVELLLERIAGIEKSIKATLEKKKYTQAAELGSTEEHFWQALNTLRLGADGDDSAMKVCASTDISVAILPTSWPCGAMRLTLSWQVRERELVKQVGTATTALMKKNSEAALNNYRDLMQVGHTPVATPRGSRFLVIDYERPRTQENNMLIDLLAPDQHQLWRGTLRHNHLKGWIEKHHAMKHRYDAVLNKVEYQRKRAQALAFSKEPFPSISELEEPTSHVPALKNWRPAWMTSRPSEVSLLRAEFQQHSKSAVFDTRPHTT